MQIRFININKETVKYLEFENNDEYIKFYSQVLIALADSTNSQVAIYQRDGDNQIFPALFLKNCYVIASEAKSDVDVNEIDAEWN